MVECDKKFVIEAKKIFDMLEGFGLLKEEASESDKNAFIDQYIQFRKKGNKT
jgi:hypothetical protein